MAKNITEKSVDIIKNGSIEEIKKFDRKQSIVWSSEQGSNSSFLSMLDRYMREDKGMNDFEVNVGNLSSYTAGRSGSFDVTRSQKELMDIILQHLKDPNETYKLLTETKDEHGRNPLMRSICSQPYTYSKRVLTYALLSQVNNLDEARRKQILNMQDSHGETALYHLCRFNEPEMAYLIPAVVEMGADPNILTNSNETALSVAVQQKFNPYIEATKGMTPEQKSAFIKQNQGALYSCGGKQPDRSTDATVEYLLSKNASPEVGEIFCADILEGTPDQGKKETMSVFEYTLLAEKTLGLNDPNNANISVSSMRYKITDKNKAFSQLLESTQDEITKSSALRYTFRDQINAKIDAYTAEIEKIDRESAARTSTHNETKRTEEGLRL